MKDKRIEAKQDYMKGMTYQQIADHYNVSIHTVKSWKRRYGWQRQKTSSKQAHSIFNQFLSDETIEIMEKMDGRTSLDLIWDQIQIQYAAIIRAQRIMYVADQEDMIKELKKAVYMPSSLEETGEGIQTELDITSEEYSFQFSWDRHATFLNAQSRAMGELRRLIKQFEELAHAKDERRLRLKQIELTIEKTKKAVREEKEEDLQIMIKRKEDDS
ncbi:phage terminase small subunit [Bacillus safensis]|uniref:phage terminase small subunit n=1 Tax=Bacillus safensis TaxID=561879 RepID=UPI0024992B80|nr:phage terminase small subunit [Bacillus safensis]GMG79848.1 phage terminase small subunit [Bacillus safensis]